jgi:hypothetical protein
MLLHVMAILSIQRPFGIIYSLLVQFVVIWYIFTFWYVWTKKNLATLVDICVSPVRERTTHFNPIQDISVSAAVQNPTIRRARTLAVK